MFGICFKNLFFYFVLQAYGGAISATVGSSAWSLIAVGSTKAISLDTRCINCQVRLTNIFISESIALSSVGRSSQGVFVRTTLL